jgi:hypothetical protein
MILVIWPVISYGYSTGLAPIQVRIRKLMDKNQNVIFCKGLNLLDILFCFLNGMIAMMRIDMTRAITPPSLLGIDRRIAYANRKYHSG